MRVEVTYHYGDMEAVWDGWTGTLLLFSREGERLSVLPASAYTKEEAEAILRDELGYVPQEQSVRYAGYNLFPFP
jgi:hypothetical protein